MNGKLGWYRISVNLCGSYSISDGRGNGSTTSTINSNASDIPLTFNVEARTHRHAVQVASKKLSGMNYVSEDYGGVMTVAKF